MKKINKHIHFVGIKGVGMTPLAIIAKEAGFTVTGSDLPDTFITDPPLQKAGIHPQISFSSEHIKDASLVITTGAHGGYDNPEVQAATAKNIPVITKGEAVGLFMDGGIFGRKLEGIAIAGSHGKTTTTAMLATILKENKRDPSFLIGTGDVVSLGQPGHYGKGNYFIAEADEYATEPTYNKTAQFLWQHPKIAIFTNIDFDHPDVYPNLDSVREVFLEFAKQLPEDGMLIAYGDDHEMRKLLMSYKGNYKTYGFLENNDYTVTRTHTSGNQTFFWMSSNNANLGEFIMRVPGEHNVLNATAACIAALETGLQLDEIKKGLRAFLGSTRRLQYIGQLETGAYLYDDYAHHPTEIKKTIQAVRAQYPKKIIVLIFQPHTYSRTKKLFDQFTRSFNDVDTVILSDIYASLREEKDSTISSQLLAQEVAKHHKHVEYLPSLPDAVEYINEKKFKDNTVLLTMGAGDIYKINEKLQMKS